MGKFVLLSKIISFIWFVCIDVSLDVKKFLKIL